MTLKLQPMGAIKVNHRPPTPLGFDLPKELLDMLAILRVATLEEVAEAVCFLAGPNADYVAGATLEVSGGYPI